MGLGVLLRPCVAMILMVGRVCYCRGGPQQCRRAETPPPPPPPPHAHARTQTQLRAMAARRRAAEEEEARFMALAESDPFNPEVQVRGVL